MSDSFFIRCSLERALNAARRRGIQPTLFLVTVSVQDQRLYLLRRHAPPQQYQLLHDCRISTSRFGIGQQRDSNRTPLGLHRIAAKIGGGCMVGTVFWGRKPTGLTWAGLAGAPIVHRILWLGGLEPGFNQGGEVDSYSRFIYIHGTGEEMNLGRPASKGCIQVGAKDLIPLFSILPMGSLVWIDRH